MGNLNFTDVPEIVQTATDRSGRAREYEERVNGLFNLAMRVTVQNPVTIPDAAAIIQYGPAISSKLGDLADQDERVRRALDLITSGSDNPYVALTLATLPLVAQVMRNHETKGDTRAVKRLEMRVPFTKRMIGFNFRFKLRNPFLRSMTHEPANLVQATFGDATIRAALAAQGIEVPGFESSK